ncbi:MAG TPA: response regulator [Usitatibacter sp.]|nr:response regulator [Usitatibacter sp.]
MGFNDLKPANVLAVDDQRANLVALDAVLGREFNVIPATSAAEAISILASRQDVDVILMDIQMPIMDGFEAARAIKKMDGCGDIPIVFITAVYNEDPFIKQGYQVGAVDYFSKPFDPEILKVKVGIYASFRQKAQILKERARQIRESEELLRAGRKLSALLENLAVGVIVTDIQGRVRHTNRAVIDLCKSMAPAHGSGVGSILGWWRHDGQPIGELPAALASTLVEGEASANVPVELPCADGSPKSISCSVSPLCDLEGRVVGATVVVHDVTERRQVERDLESHMVRLVSAGAALAPE